MLYEGEKVGEKVCEGGADFVGHEHVPGGDGAFGGGGGFFVCDDKAELLKHVGHLALLAGNVGVGASFDEFVKELQFCLAQNA